MIFAKTSPMPPVAAQPDPAVRVPHLGWLLLAASTLLVAIALAYGNATSGPFVFDDTPTMVENASIRQLATALSPPNHGLPVTGRPVANLTFAINYALGGLDPRGYHVANIVLHGLNALLLFGLVRRTLALGRLRESRAGVFFGWAVALVWAVHPLTTAAVTYVSQRAEVLMALCYLATLYTFSRALRSPRPTLWLALSASVCWLGMATKEVMATAPLVVLLYDRTFGARTFLGALRTRWAYYLALAASWGVLGYLTATNGGRGGTAGFAIGITPWTYALTQCDALVHYLRLAFWPSPLVFDYGGTRLITDPLRVTPQAILLVILGVATLVALQRKPAVGFVAASWFLILAPTSSIVPVADTMFEHRMYLPLAAVVTVVVDAAWRWLGHRALWGVLICIPLAITTARRNEDYRSEVALWADTVAKQPDNVRAHYTLGVALAAEGRLDEALSEFETALHLDPKSAPAHNGLANVLTKLGRYNEAIASYEAALRTAPSAEAHNNLANVLLRVGQGSAARHHYEAALRLREDLADAHNNLGNLLAQSREFPAAVLHYQAALKLRPDLADAHANLGNVLAQSDRLDEAIRHYEAAIKARPGFADAHFNLATTFARRRQWAEAAAAYDTVLKLNPAYPGARENLERAKLAREILGR